MSESISKGCLNFEGVGKIIAVIKDEREPKKETKKNRPNQELYVCDNKDAKDIRYSAETSIRLPEGYRFQYSVDRDIERQIVYIAGSSGSGKSHWCRQFIAEYHKAYPSRPVYIISALTEDTTLDKLKYIQRVKLTPELLEDELKSCDFADSLVVLDDCDTIANRKIRKKVLEIQSDLLSTGRHYNVSVLVTTHTPCSGLESKLILNECHACVIFPSGLGGRAKSYLLEAYLGLDKRQIKKLNDIDSRSICFIKGYPQVVLAEQDAYILN